MLPMRWLIHLYPNECIPFLYLQVCFIRLTVLQTTYIASHENKIIHSNPIMIS